MTNPFLPSLAKNFEESLRMMEAAIGECPEELWERDLWPDEAPTAPLPDGGIVGSAPWLIAFHALLCLDYDLNGEFDSWEPPKPFDENTWGEPNRLFTQPELLGYVEHCRVRARATVDGLTDEAAARKLPSPHRYEGTPFAEMIGGMPLHLVEHATQIRQFLRDNGVKTQPLPGDQRYTG